MNTVSNLETAPRPQYLHIVINSEENSPVQGNDYVTEPTNEDIQDLQKKLLIQLGKGMPANLDRGDRLSYLDPGTEMDRPNELNHLTVFVPYNSGPKPNNAVDK